MISLLLIGSIFLGVLLLGVNIFGKEFFPSFLFLFAPFILIAFFLMNKRIKKTRYFILENILFFLVIIIFSVSLLFSKDPLRGGYVIFYFIVAFFLRYTLLIFVPSEKYIPRVNILLSLIPILIVCMSIFFSYRQGISLYQSIMMRNVVMTLGKSNALATYLLSLAPVLLGIFFMKDSKSYFVSILSFAGFIFCIFGIIMTSSRGGTISFLFGIVLFFILSVREIKRNKISFFLVIAGFLIFLLYEGGLLTKLAFRSQKMFMSANWYARLDMWGVAKEMFISSPLIGKGLGSYAFFYSQLGNFYSSGMRATHAHNMILQLLSETGLLGTIIFFALIFLLLGNSFKYNSRLKQGKLIGFGAIVGCFALLLHSMVEPTIFSPSGMAFLLFLLSFNEFIYAMEKKKISDPL